MKSAYELAMERLNKQSPQAKVTDKQKKEIAELESIFAAKIAEREIHFKGEAIKAEMSGDFETAEKARQQLVHERKKLQSDLEDKKERVRSGS
jgi:hypothetical protein